MIHSTIPNVAGHTEEFSFETELRLSVTRLKTTVCPSTVKHRHFLASADPNGDVEYQKYSRRGYSRKFLSCLPRSAVISDEQRYTRALRSESEDSHFRY